MKEKEGLCDSHLLVYYRVNEAQAWIIDQQTPISLVERKECYKWRVHQRYSTDKYSKIWIYYVISNLKGMEKKKERLLSKLNKNHQD